MDCHNLEGLDVKPRTYNPEDKFYWNDFVETKLKHSFRTISTEYLLDYRVKNVPWKLTTLTGLQWPHGLAVKPGALLVFVSILINHYIQHPRDLQVGLLFTWALAKKAEMRHSIYWISTVRAWRESLHTYFQQSWGVHQTYRRSALKLLSTLIWMISQSREQLQPIWGQIWACLENHILLEELLSKVTHKYPQMYLQVTSTLSQQTPKQDPFLRWKHGRLARALQW